jgi:hypothetical protein
MSADEIKSAGAPGCGQGSIFNFPLYSYPHACRTCLREASYAHSCTLPFGFFLFFSFGEAKEKDVT